VTTDYFPALVNLLAAGAPPRPLGSRHAPHPAAAGSRSDYSRPAPAGQTSYGRAHAQRDYFLAIFLDRRLLTLLSRSELFGVGYLLHDVLSMTAPLLLPSVLSGLVTGGRIRGPRFAARCYA